MPTLPRIRVNWIITESLKGFGMASSQPDESDPLRDGVAKIYQCCAHWPRTVQILLLSGKQASGRTTAISNPTTSVVVKLDTQGPMKKHHSPTGTVDRAKLTVIAPVISPWRSSWPSAIPFLVISMLR